MSRTLADIRVEYKLSDRPYPTITKQVLTFSKNPETACTIPVGTPLNIFFSKVRPDRCFFEYNGALRLTTLTNAHKYFKGFKPCPSFNSLERSESERGGCFTPLGNFVEPDGYDNFGCPSWMLVIGVI